MLGDMLMLSEIAERLVPAILKDKGDLVYFYKFAVAFLYLEIAIQSICNSF